MTALSKYSAYVRLSILTGIAFRWQVVWGFVTGLFIMAFHIFLWNSVYAHTAEVGGMTLNQILNYFLLVQTVSTVTSTRIDREISRGITRGEILNRLIRPSNLYMQSIFSHIGSVAWNLLLSGVPVFILSLFLIQVAFPGSFLLFMIFIYSVLLGLLISYNINFLAGITAAWVRGSEGITHAKDFLMMVCAGSILPLSFYPPVLQHIFSWMPFRYVISVPITIYLGKTADIDLIRILATGSIWLLALCLVNVFLCEKACRRITVFGG
jgi:ABC-2 type transport system permease protein